MRPVTFRTDMSVSVTRVEGCDLDVARAAWVSTKGARAADEANEARVRGLITMLMRDRHGSPFEQVGFQFMTEAPLFVWREHDRHRTFSKNEESGRYRKLNPVFYVPEVDRALVQVGAPSAYTLEAGTSEQYGLVVNELQSAAESSYAAYEFMLKQGVAREVARMVLPLNIYSTSYVRANLRALMNFLSLRRNVATAAFPSFPQREIEMVAELYEEAFSKHFPVTYGAYLQNGRVAP